MLVDIALLLAAAVIAVPLFKRFGLGAYARLSRRNICVTSCDNALTV